MACLVGILVGLHSFSRFGTDGESKVVTGLGEVVQLVTGKASD